MNKAANKKATDYADRIPTLTEIVPRPEPSLGPDSVPAAAAIPTVEAAPVKAAKAPAIKASELPKDMAQTVERLVYKALYRQLPALSKEISNEIIQTLEKQLHDKKSR
jgi:hypothetical protein